MTNDVVDAAGNTHADTGVVLAIHGGAGVIRRECNMLKLPNKEALKAELVQLVSADLQTLERAQKAAKEGATHEEAKPENDKDTRAVEQSYLARGQAGRVEELRVGLAWVQTLPTQALAPGAKISLGALVAIEDEGEAASLVLLIAPYGGGYKLAGGQVQVVTPKSPLGQGIVGKLAGDDCEVRLGGRVRLLSIVAVK